MLTLVLVVILEVCPRSYQVERIRYGTSRHIRCHRGNCCNHGKCPQPLRLRRFARQFMAVQTNQLFSRKRIYGIEHTRKWNVADQAHFESREEGRRSLFRIYLLECIRNSVILVEADDLQSRLHDDYRIGHHRLRCFGQGRCRCLIFLLTHHICLLQHLLHVKQYREVLSRHYRIFNERRRQASQEPPWALVDVDVARCLSESHTLNFPLLFGLFRGLVQIDGLRMHGAALTCVLRASFQSTLTVLLRFYLVNWTDLH